MSRRECLALLLRAISSNRRRPALVVVPVAACGVDVGDDHDTAVRGAAAWLVEVLLRRGHVVNVLICVNDANRLVSGEADGVQWR